MSENKLKKFLITTTPASPDKGKLAVVEAVNELAALDEYAVATGFVPYTEIEGGGRALHQYVGVDQYGVWGVYTNTTIWALQAWSSEQQQTPEMLRTQAREWVSDVLSHGNDLLRDLVDAPSRVIEEARRIFSITTEPPFQRIIYDGLWVTVTRNSETGQLIVVINSGGIDAKDRVSLDDPDEMPFLEVVVNDGTVIDWDRSTEQP